ncbi:hypothetical protein H0H93_007234 [Arthromyces matolae]|nr:hypothetical protein H0H93_007234 [Arthromyces matolae]
MPMRRTPERPQQTISSYFKSSQRSSPGKRASSPIQLVESDEEPPRKRSKTSGTLNDFHEPTTPSRAGPADQWRFVSASPTTSESTAPKKRTEAETVAIKDRREAFKKRLLLDNNPFARKSTLSAVSPLIEQEAESAGEEPDHAFQEFMSAVHSKKGKGKEKSKRTGAASTKRGAVGPSGETYTPLEEQVLQLKAENTGTVLFFEVGYKYRFFGDDAKIAAEELGMVAFQHRNFLVASIPTHRLNVHMKKLLSRGYRVGIVGQTETAALKKASDNRNAPFNRKLLHLYTAATYVDDLGSVDDLERYNPSPLMCIVEQGKKGTTGDVMFGMITICPSTGDVVWDDFEDTLMRIELETRLVHSRPAELLLPKNGLSGLTAKMLQHFTRSTSAGDRTRTEHFDETMSYTDAFDFVSQFYTNKTQAAVASESFNSGRLMAEVADFPKRVVIALAHAIKHLSAFSIADAFLETKFFTKFTTKTHMLLAANTLTNLEIYRNETDGTTNGTLLWLLDKTKTKFGARMLRSWIGRPLVDRRALQERVTAVEEILESSSEKLAKLREVLRGLPDLARGVCRIQYGQILDQCLQKCTPQELAILLPAFGKVAEAFDCVATPSDVGFRSNILNEIIYTLPKLKDSIKGLLSSVRLGAAAEGRKDTMWTDLDRYPEIGDAEVPPAVREKVDERLRYEETLQAAANQAFSSFLQDIALNHYTILRDVVNKLAVADCLFSLALVALQEHYVRPIFTDDDTLEIVDGRHPMVEALRPDPFVPNTIVMGDAKPRNKIITGPNMGGKSSCVRMVALIAVMAQIGSYVPATSVKMGLLDSVLTRMGASDDLARGRSTFMVEMSETSEILSSATKHSLVILDELGRGTSTFDGMSIADAVLQHLVETVQAKTLFITHYPMVASSIEKRYPSQVENLHMGFEEETRISGVREITFLYRLAPGMATGELQPPTQCRGIYLTSQGSFGIECGRLAGLPEPILSVARELATKLRVQITHRTKRNRLLKSTKLLAECLKPSTVGIMGDAKIEELRILVQSILDLTPL